MTAARLAYGDLLLFLMRRELARGTVRGMDMGQFNELCDRFERLRAHLARPTLVWEGDSA